MTPYETDFDPGLEEALHNARVRGVNGGLKASVCTMCIVIEHARPWVKDYLVAAAAGTISVRALHKALRASGVRLDRNSIQQHRNEAHTP